MMIFYGHRPRLEKQIQAINMIEGTNFKDYLKSIENLTNKLASINVEVEGIKLIHIILDGLLLSWGLFLFNFGSNLAIKLVLIYT